MASVLDEKRSDILHYLYDTTTYHRFLTLYQLEIQFGMSAIALRSLLEDLKEQGLVVEVDGGFHISSQGKQFGQSRWL